MTIRLVSVNLVLTWTLAASCFGDELPGRAASETALRSEIRLVPLKQVRVEDGFWAPKLRTIKQRTIPHSWQYVEGEIRALRRAAGETVEGEPNGTWGEANLYKVMETVAYALALFPDAELEKRMDEIVARVAAAQRPDGYMHAYVTNAGKPPWDPAFLDGSHDGYVLGHMIEAAIEYYAATGKPQFLDVARKAADQAHRHFLGPQGKPGFCGHAELEMALVELYRATDQQRYLDLARALIEWRGRGLVAPAGPTPRAYFQDAVPLRNQRTLEGHAVRAVFFATGVADVAVARRERDYRLVANRFWDSTTMRRMTITGSVGPRREHEAFGEDYELPLDGYYESCAACGLADFAQRMFLLEGRAECADVLERVLYNAVLHGIALDGTSTYYQNPLCDHDRPRDNCWVCCPPNLSRTVLQIGRYAYGHTEHEVFVNLYVGGRCTVPLAAGPLQLDVQTDYPWQGKVRIDVSPEKPGSFAVNLRIPGWCDRAALQLNGRPVEPLPVNDRGYARLDRIWQPGETITLELAMPVERILAHPNVRDCQGRVALQRGPIVYGFEGLDNQGLPRIELGADPRDVAEYRPDLLGGVTVVRGHTADGQAFTAVPFFALANRDKSWQKVWVAQRGLKPSSAWWEGRLYRPLRLERLQP
ncbi:MAG: glycoside hydrolase family 127 protein [Pirellulales bacterium]|nr:glycoside hydrolase family 127 protein [Pirellulales bacterium]